MSKSDSVYDLVVIGTGVAATIVTWECHSAGWKIAIIDSRPVILNVVYMFLGGQNNNITVAAEALMKLLM